MKDAVFKSTRWSAYTLAASRILALVSYVYVAREIGPEALGLLAIVFLVLEFLNVIAEAGISSALIQAKDTTRRQRATLYSIEWILALVVFSIAVVVSIALSRYFESPELPDLLLVASVSLPLSTAGRQIMALMQRSFSFKALRIFELGRDTLRFVAVILFVSIGFDIWSVVIAHVISVAAFQLMLLSYGMRHRLFSGFGFSLKETRQLLRFGMYRSGSLFLNRVAARVDQALIAGFLGPAELGVYSLASRLTSTALMQLQGVTSRVSFSMFSRQQHDIELAKRTFLRLISLQAFVVLPLIIWLIFASEALVQIVLGDEWLGVHVLINILALFTMVRMSEASSVPLVSGLGRSDWLFVWSVFAAVGFSTAIYFSARFGDVVTVAYTMLALQVIAAVCFYFFIQRRLLGGFAREYLGAFSTALICSLLSVLPAFAVGMIPGMPRDGIAYILALVVAAPLYLLLSIAFNKSTLVTFLDVMSPKISAKFRRSRSDET